MNAIILAAGNASRLGLSNIQKCMISFGGRLAIDLLIDKLPPVDEICVCIGTDFRAALLKQYLLNKYHNKVLRFVVQREPIGTANGVYLCLKDSKYDDAIITWSDVIPTEQLPTLDKSTIFVSDTSVMRFVSRYRLDDGIISPISNNVGNIMGMFFIKDAKTLLPKLENSTDDFVDVLIESNNTFDSYNIDFYDFGTEESLRLTTNDMSTSSHATITVADNKVIKTYKKEDTHMFDVESTWYKCADRDVLHYMPKIYDIYDSTIVMEWLDAHPFSEIDDEHKAKNFLAKVVFILSEYFHRYKYPSDEYTIFQEYIDRTINRCDVVFKSVPGLSNDTININGESFINPMYLLTDNTISSKICDVLIPPTFTSIHGDPTLQNILQKGSDVWFIDPRGKFGDLWLFGDPKVDFTKIYFSLKGNYDGLNVGNYYLRTDGRYFEYRISKNRFSSLSEWYITYLNDTLSIDRKKIELLHSLLWLRTVGYDFTKSVEQAIVSFLNGTVYFNSIIKEI